MIPVTTKKTNPPKSVKKSNAKNSNEIVFQKAHLNDFNKIEIRFAGGFHR